MDLKLCSIAAALALAFATPALAQQKQDTAKDTGTKVERPGQSQSKGSEQRKVKDAEEERIEAEYKAAKAKCDAMKGNEKDLCEKEAKAKEKVAKAELDAKNNPSQRSQRKVAETKAEAEYDVAKAKCDMMKGDEKSACQKQAKAKHDQARADIKKQYAARSDDKSQRERTATSGATSK